ncbi:hypothetical protein [Edaphosphingomonas haloaromaticamans]|uniref:Uncharacterized protein n=1 Tax=Edaphosphingomonas haloaromaticamans TaxID=653954 RepID=A0A1S1HH77_9SPHN|nr:hypothetical protein [Sphingomonas haloaromaticamans]OHT21594.1 hypothetical protein BHE75_03605 [Sphingomonas haloaromaticamans]
MTGTVRLSANDIRQLRNVAEQIAQGERVASRYTIEIAERFHLTTGRTALNILAISDDPDWADTDLNTTHPWSRIHERHELVNGRALFDLYVYERPPFGETGDLVCCDQAELDARGLAAIHADSAKDIWRRLA